MYVVLHAVNVESYSITFRSLLNTCKYFSTLRNLTKTINAISTKFGTHMTDSLGMVSVTPSTNDGW